MFTKLGKHKERYYQVKKSFVSVPVFMESSLAFLCNIFLQSHFCPHSPTKTMPSKYPVTLLAKENGHLRL